MTPLRWQYARAAATTFAGAWTGKGISSTSAAAAATSAHKTAIGYVDAAALGSTSVDATAALVRYTLAGDSDLNRTVDLTAFTFLTANFNGTGKDWLHGGDYNYDGTVNLTDFTFLASNFNLSLPAGNGSSGLSPSIGTTVPEPTATLIASGIALRINCRRRRRTS